MWIWIRIRQHRGCLHGVRRRRCASGHRHLKKIQNSAARLVCKATNSDHIRPILQSLHWLPVTHRIQYKISATCVSVLQFRLWHIPSVSVRSSSASYTRILYSSCKHKRPLGERSFSYAGPTVWNSLPQTLRHSDSSSFCQGLPQTHLFNTYF